MLEGAGIDWSEAVLFLEERKEEKRLVVLGRFCRWWRVPASPGLGTGGRGSFSLSLMELGGEEWLWAVDLSWRSSSS